MKYNLENFWNYYFFKYFLELWYIRKYIILNLIKLNFLNPHLQPFLSYISVFYLNDFNNANSTRNFKFNIFTFCGKKQNTLWCFEDASYPISHFKNLETNANQHSVIRSWMKITLYLLFLLFLLFFQIKTNFSNIIWTNFRIITIYFFKYFLELWHIRKFSTLHIWQIAFFDKIVDVEGVTFIHDLRTLILIL